jgi:hypothetical protein
LERGIEIMRKALSQHEIATRETTAIDREAGLVRLATFLLPASGRVAGVRLSGLPNRRGRRAPTDGVALT